MRTQTFARIYRSCAKDAIGQGVLFCNRLEERSVTDVIDQLRGTGEHYARGHGVHTPQSDENGGELTPPRVLLRCLNVVLSTPQRSWLAKYLLIHRP